MKKLSIIIPTYNAEKTIEKCLESILKQDCSDIEILIINDGSKDKTEEVVRNYIDDNRASEKIQYYKKNNSGVADTRNYGIKKARGEYIWFVDSDDYIDNSIINIIKNNMQKQIDILKFKLVKVNKNGDIIEKFEGPLFNEISGQQAFDLLYSNDKMIDSLCIYVFKKSLFRKEEFKMGTYHEDFGIIPILIVKASKMSSIENIGYYYIQGNESITRNKDYMKTIKRAYDILLYYDLMIEKTKNMNLRNKTLENIKIYYTNGILLKVKELETTEKKQYIKEIKKRKLYKNIKARNPKQLLKRILIFLNIRIYLKVIRNN